MASDVSLSDGEMENWEDNEDWTSTQWADPNSYNNVTPISHPGIHQDNNIEGHSLNIKALQNAKNIPSASGKVH